jgi:SPP1 gp7 family putative phage head morphogenesis protein
MYPLHLENQYEKFFETQFAKIARRLNREVLLALKNEARTDGDRRHDTPLEDIMALILGLKDQLGDWIDAATLEKQIARNFHLLDAWSRDKTAEAISTLLSRLNTPQLPSVTGRPAPTGATGELWLTTVNMLSGNTGMTAAIRDRMIKQNLGLIRSLAYKHLDDMTRILVDGLTQGKTLKEMTDSIEHLTGVNRSKAKFWAADQASKFFGEVTKERQTSAGIPGYIWRTLKDGRVRDNHGAVSGKYFDWKNPPAVGSRGRRVHPGEDFRCRCWAEPAFGKDYEDPMEKYDPLEYMRKNTPHAGTAPA